MANDAPQGLLRTTPGAVARPPGGGSGDGGAGDNTPTLAERLRTRNRHRNPTALAVTNDDIDIVPVLSEDNPGLTISKMGVSTAGSATIIGLADAEPSQGTGISIYIGGGDPVFQGHISNAVRDEAGIVTATAYDFTRALRQKPYSGSFDGASVGQAIADIAGHAGVRTNIDAKYFSLDDLDIQEGVQRVAEEQGVDSTTGETTSSEGGGATGEAAAGQGQAEYTYPTVTHDFHNVTCAAAIDDLAASVNAAWFVKMSTNELRITDRPDVRNYLVNGVMTSRAGEQGVPYQKVVIIGGSGSAPEGERREARASKDVIRGVAGDADAPDDQTYTDTRPSVKSQEMANNVAAKVWQMLERQRKQGDVKLHGRKELGLLDRVTLPPYHDSRRYLVGGITHRIEADEGFMSIVHTGSGQGSPRGDAAEIQDTNLDAPYDEDISGTEPGQDPDSIPTMMP